MRGVAGFAVVVAALGVPGAASGQSAPDLGEAFEPSPVSEPLYGSQAPSVDPARQQHHVIAEDGTRLYVETWLPAPRDGNVPPERVPTVLVMSPYLTRGSPGYSVSAPPETFTSRGYAYAQMHLRGTGESDGCLGRLGPDEADDGARVIQYLGRDAPWTNGSVGTFGISHAGGSQTAAASFGDPSMTQYLKAMVPLAPDLSRYSYSSFDGVPYFAHAPLVRYEQNEFRPGGTPQRYSQRLECKPDTAASNTDTSGDFRPFDAAREHRLGVENIEAAVLSVHGHRDINVTPVSQSGFFDELPATTPRVGLFGVFDHEFPHRRGLGVRQEWERSDFLPMVIAWFDRYLKGLDSGVEEWPRVQVQGTDGQWRTEPDWPLPAGAPAQLALGSGGKLGAEAPSGATSYREGFFENTRGLRPPGTAAVFETPPLAGRLELTGQPVLDAWVQLDRADGHLAAKLEALDATGDPVPFASTVGFRSLQHLDPLRRNVFVQSRPTPAPIGRPLAVRLRFNPTDIVVPEKGWLRLTISGSQPARGGIESAVLRDQTGVRGVPQVYEDPSALSGSATEVTILHDCEHPSALRFLLPDPETALLNVRESDEPASHPLVSSPAPPPGADGGGAAVAPVCGEAPREPPAP